MKNLRKILAVLLAVTMLLGLAAAEGADTAPAAETEVQTEAPAEEGVTEEAPAEEAEQPGEAEEAEEAPAEEAEEAPAEEAAEEAVEEAPAEKAAEEAAAGPDWGTAEDPVLAYVNGEPIHKSDCDEIISYYAEQGQSWTYSRAVEQLKFNRILELTMREEGYLDFTPEEEEALRAEIQASWDEYIEQYVNYFLSEDTEEARAALRAEAEQSLLNSGYSIDELMESQRLNKGYERLENALVPEEAITDEMVDEYYAGIVAQHQATVGDSAYMRELYSYFYGDIYYLPSGYRYISHILLIPDSDILAAYTSAKQNYDALAEQLAALEAEQAEPQEETPEEPAVSQEEIDAARQAMDEAWAAYITAKAAYEALTGETVTVQEPVIGAPEAAAEEETAEEEPAAEEPAAEEPATEEAAEEAPAEEPAEEDLVELIPAEDVVTEETAEEAPAEETPDDLAAQLEAARLEMEAAKEAVLLNKAAEIADIEARLQAGEAFETLVAQYNEDPGLDPAVGYLVHPESIQWDPVFRDAAFSPEMAQPGDHSLPVVGSNGIHILYYLADAEAGAVPMTDEMRQGFVDDLRNQKLNDAALAIYQETLARVEILQNSEQIALLDAQAQPAAQPAE